MPPCSSRRNCAASKRSSRSEARRPLRHSPTERRAFPRLTRYSDRVMPGSPRQSNSSPLIPAGAACDLPAGPSEVLVIADDTARADFVAADLLAQAEHDTQAQAILVTSSRRLAECGEDRSAEADAAAIPPLHPRGVARGQPFASSCRMSKRRSMCANLYAAEHLILEVQRAAAMAAANPECRLSLSRRLVTGAHGRLLFRNQPCAADLRLRARLQRPVGAGFRQGHDCAGAVARQVCGRWDPWPSSSPGSKGLDAHASAVTRRLDVLERWSSRHELGNPTGSPRHRGTEGLRACRVGTRARTSARQRASLALAGRRFAAPGSTDIPSRNRARWCNGLHRCTTSLLNRFSSVAAATKQSTCWCAGSAVPARTASSSVRPPLECTRSPHEFRARKSCTVPLRADAGFALDDQAVSTRMHAATSSSSSSALRTIPRAIC